MVIQFLRSLLNSTKFYHEGGNMNLIEGMLSEMDRCRDLIKIYNTIPTGAFGAAMIKQDIVAAEKAINSGDTVEMIRCYKSLKNCK